MCQALRQTGSVPMELPVWSHLPPMLLPRGILNKSLHLSKPGLAHLQGGNVHRNWKGCREQRQSLCRAQGPLSRFQSRHPTRSLAYANICWWIQYWRVPRPQEVRPLDLTENSSILKNKWGGSTSPTFCHCVTWYTYWTAILMCYFKWIFLRFTNACKRTRTSIPLCCHSQTDNSKSRTSLSYYF